MAKRASQSTPEQPPPKKPLLEQMDDWVKEIDEVLEAEPVTLKRP